MTTEIRFGGERRTAARQTGSGVFGARRFCRDGGSVYTEAFNPVIRVDMFDREALLETDLEVA